MALSELAAVEAAFQVLQPLDEAGRRRALQWLSDALGAEGPPPPSAPGTVTTVGPASEDRGPQRAPEAKAVSTRTPRRRPSAETVAAKNAGAETPTGRPRRVRAAKPPAAAVQSPERIYRRMPPAEDVMAAYQQVGSVSGLADHFGVPRYTAQGWARQLRKQGHTIGRVS